MRSNYETEVPASSFSIMLETKRCMGIYMSSSVNENGNSLFIRRSDFITNIPNTQELNGANDKNILSLDAPFCRAVYEGANNQAFVSPNRYCCFHILNSRTIEAMHNSYMPPLQKTDFEDALIKSTDGFMKELIKYNYSIMQPLFFYATTIISANTTAIKMLSMCYERIVNEIMARYQIVAPNKVIGKQLDRCILSTVVLRMLKVKTIKVSKMSTDDNTDNENDEYVKAYGIINVLFNATSALEENLSRPDINMLIN